MLKTAFAGLLSSRKFVVVVLASLILGAFVMTGRMPVTDYVGAVEKLSLLLVTMIGVEGAAEKFGFPPASSPRQTVNVTMPPPADVPIIHEEEITK